MAVVADNDCVLVIGGQTLDTLAVEVDFGMDIETVDITHGFRGTHMQRDDGLIDTSLELTLAYDAASWATDKAQIIPGSRTVAIQIDGAGSGLPDHSGSYVLKSVKELKRAAKPDKLFIKLSYEQAAAPTTDMFNGDVQ